VDYYTTGNLPYYGVTPGGSDSTNRWVKKGFLYVTGPNETSFTLTIRNNAPGGGGNDWALDDINVSTCLPNMNYSPTTTPIICYGNTMTIGDTVRSYYNTYRYYKWQYSSDGGTTWTDIPGATGVGSPVWNGSSWQYVTSYTLTPGQTQLSNNGDKYRVVVGTTAANVLNPNCNFTDGIAIITLNVINCGPMLDVNLLSFSGKPQNGKAVLNWTTGREEETVSFDIERSTDGMNYFKIGTVSGYNDPTLRNNQYNFTDTALLVGRTFYRLALQTGSGRRTLSHTIQLQGDGDAFNLGNIVNPFTTAVSFDIIAGSAARLEVSLLNSKGQEVRKRNYPLYAGVNNLSMEDAQSLPAGIYILQLQYKGKVITRKLVKR
jgi:hypothetical protein